MELSPEKETTWEYPRLLHDKGQDYPPQLPLEQEPLDRLNKPPPDRLKGELRLY
jgi:hypothetical protein